MTQNLVPSSVQSMDIPRFMDDLVCDHLEYDVLRNHLNGPIADHDVIDGKCRTCGQLILVTCFASGYVDYSVMSIAYAVEQGYTSRVLAFDDANGVDERVLKKAGDYTATMNACRAADQERGR